MVLRQVPAAEYLKPHRAAMFQPLHSGRKRKQGGHQAVDGFESQRMLRAKNPTVECRLFSRCNLLPLRRRIGPSADRVQAKPFRESSVSGCSGPSTLRRISTTCRCIAFCFPRILPWPSERCGKTVDRRQSVWIFWPKRPAANLKRPGGKAFSASG